MQFFESKLRKLSALLFLTILSMIVLTLASNVGPVDRIEDSMSFAAFTDTHVGQHTRSPQWGYADYLDRLAIDIMDNTLPCEFGPGTPASLPR